MEPLHLRDDDGLEAFEERDDAPTSDRQPVLRLAVPRVHSSAAPPLRIAARRKNSLVFLDASEVWAFEADARLTFIHCAQGRLDIDVPLAEVEASALGERFVRVHRGWLANLALVKALEHAPGETNLFVGSKLGERTGIRVPVSRDRTRPVRDMLLASAIGVRRRES
jgi:two-component system, LytTR family, response regulator LytT